MNSGGSDGQIPSLTISLKSTDLNLRLVEILIFFSMKHSVPRRCSEHLSGEGYLEKASSSPSSTSCRDAKQTNRCTLSQQSVVTHFITRHRYLISRIKKEATQCTNVTGVSGGSKNKSSSVCLSSGKNWVHFIFFTFHHQSNQADVETFLQ